MNAALRELRTNDIFTVGGVEYRKIPLRYDPTTGLANALNTTTDAPAYFDPSIRVVPNAEYYQVRSTPTTCVPLLRRR